MINPNIRTRSAYTFFNSLLKIDDIINFAIKNNFSHTFLVDKNYMHGAMEFYLKAKKHNLQPVIGLEIDYQDINKILIAKNEKGYRSLLKISTVIGLGENLPIEILNNSNLIEVSPLHPIISYNNPKDKSILEMFSSISNVDLPLEISHLLEISKPELEKEIKNITEKIDFEITLKKNVIPKFGVLNSSEYLKKLLKKAIKEYLIDVDVSNPDEYIKRMKYEYSVISRMKFDDYFLIVWDIVKWSKEQGIIVGPGRGSAPGSLISFLLNITTIDPIKEGLLFERFLNPERISMPDIDIDFEDTRREEVLNYILSKYGKKNVSQIITFQTLRARMSLKDIARIKGVTPSEAETLSKLIPEGTTLEEAYNTVKKFKLNIDSNEMLREVFESAKLIEGLPRQHSTHAAGIVLSSSPIYDSVPMQKGYSDISLTQYPMDYMEINGLLKIDILGLRNLSFIKEVINLSKSKINLEKTSLNKKEVYQILADGKTSGIFQLESLGMTKVLKEMKPTNFEDIVATTSLFRPGPQKQIPHYIARKHGKEKIDYLTPELKETLQSTYGIIVYQEQIMEIAQKFSGLSLAKADILRRAIGKKEISFIKSLKEEFEEGALKNGHSKEVIKEIYDLIVKFSEYGFNRSHAFAYSVLSYQLAYLKEKYPIEFIVSLLNSYIGNSDKTIQYINEAASLNIEIKLPSVNTSSAINKVSKDNKSIYLALTTIKGIGLSAVNEILEIRKDGEFKDYIDFLTRTSLIRVTIANIDALINAGALDEFKISRNTMLENKDNILKYAELIKIKKDDKISIDLSLAPAPLIKESKIEDKNAEMEGKTLGFTLSKSTFLKEIINIKEEFTFSKDIEYKQDNLLTIAGSIKSIRSLITRTNLEMAFITIEDEFDEVNITLWPQKYGKYKNELNIGNIVVINGKVDIKRRPTIILNTLKVIKKV